MKETMDIHHKFHFLALFSKKFDKSNLFNNFLFILILTGMILFVLIPLRDIDSTDFALISWIPGQQLLKTGSVYAEYPYPLWTVISMFPLALLPLKAAEVLWFFCNWLFLSASITILISICNWKLSLPLFATIVFFSGFFLPVITSISLGQLTIFSLLILSLCVYLFVHQNNIWLGVILGLSFIKPHVLILLVAFLLLWALWQRRWRIWIGFSFVIIPLILISLPFISSDSQLIGGGIGSHVASYIRESDSLWSLLLNAGLPFFTPAIICMALLAWTGWFWFPTLQGKRMEVNEVLFLFSFTVLVNLLIIPYNWMHNFVLLLLPFIFCFSQVLLLRNSLRNILFIVIILGMNSFYLSFSFDQPSLIFKMIPAFLLLPLLIFLRSKINEEFPTKDIHANT